MPRHESWRRSRLDWAAENGQTASCAAQSPETAFKGQQSSRVNLDQAAGPEPDNNSARTPLGMARRAGDRLPPANHYLSLFLGLVAEA